MAYTRSACGLASDTLSDCESVERREVDDMVRARVPVELESGVPDEMPIVELRRERIGGFDESEEAGDESPAAADAEAERQPCSS